MRTIAFFSAAALTLACGGRDTPADTSAAATGASTAAVASTSDQSPEQEFLRRMTDHHEGLVMMATAAMTKASASGTQGDAHMLHTKQAAERDSMVAMLRTQFNVTHTPAAMERHRAQNDSLQRLTGAAYDRMFYRLVVDHHREGMAMMDSLLPRLTISGVKQMAEKMKADHTKEITEFERKASR